MVLPEVSTAASYGVTPYCAAKRCCIAAGSSGMAARTRSIQAESITSGIKSGSGK